jgi:hypothetical protein
LIADRERFCTFEQPPGIAQRAFFYIRQHANAAVVSSGTRCEGYRRDRKMGQVFRQAVTITTAWRRVALKARRIVLRLDKPTSDSDTEMAILTNLPKSAADAVAVAVVSKGWTLETMFQSLTTMFQGEIATLGYPQAACSASA